MAEEVKLQQKDSARSVKTDDEDLDWLNETHARYFMGYFWWQWKKRDYFFLGTFWAFFGPKIKREMCKSFFYSVGLAIGFMIARVFIIPDWLQSYYVMEVVTIKNK